MTPKGESNNNSWNPVHDFIFVGSNKYCTWSLTRYRWWKVCSKTFKQRQQRQVKLSTSHPRLLCPYPILELLGAGQAVKSTLYPEQPWEVKRCRQQWRHLTARIPIPTSSQYHRPIPPAIRLSSLQTTATSLYIHIQVITFKGFWLSMRSEYLKVISNHTEWETDNIWHHSECSKCHGQ